MRSRYGWFIVWAAVVLVVDQATKFWAVRALGDGQEIEVIPPLIDFRLVYNSGAAFSIGESVTRVFAIAAAAAVVGILYYARRVTSLGWALALGAVLGGAVSHLGDRLFREPKFAHGHVVDFMELPNWPVFNVADSSLVTAAVLIALLGLRGIGLDGTREGGPAESAAAK